MGADDYITKPFDEIELLSAVEARFKKIDIIFNDVKDIPGYGYNYGYGYRNKHSYKYYEEDHRSFFQRLFGRKRRNAI